MPSRLSSLLVRDGLVGVKRMEKAFQRQVIYGGSLDTILLEMGLVPDERLTQYLSLASGLPPAARGECNVFDADAVRACPEDVAHKYRVVPLQKDGDALRVLVCEPVDLTALEELADEIDLPIQPLIVPEYRWHVVYGRAYGVQAPARFTTLAKQIDSAPVTAPVGRSRTVIVEDDAGASHDRVVVDVREQPTQPTGPARAAAVQAVASDEATMRVAGVPPPQRTRTMQLSADAYQAAFADAEARRRDAARRRAPTPPDPVIDAPPEGGPAAAVAVPSAVTLSGQVGVPEPLGAQVTPHDAVIRAPLSTGATPDAEPHTPMSAVVAREALQVADNRDKIFLLLMRALRSRARYVGLLTVQGGAAIGRLAIAEPGLDTDAITTVLIPLDTRSAFRHAVISQRPHVGALVTGDKDIDAMIERMGGAVPPSGLLLPIVLRDRTVALAVAHRVDAPIGLADVAELLPLAGVAADAIGRLIVKHKSAGYRSPTASGAIVEVAADEVQTKRHERPKLASAWRIPTAQPMVPVDVDRASTAPPVRAASDLLAALEDADEGAADGLHAEAVERAAQLVPLIAERFPGKLRIDRYQVSGRALRAGQYGPLLELIVKLGPPATELLIEKMSDPSRDVRFYATVCAAELRPRSAVYALVERLFDPDYGVRACAIEALGGYPLRELDAALARARHALHSEDPERVLAAATAVAELGDVSAIPDLLDTVGRSGRRAEHARRALASLTKQDFGTSERKWRRWWDEHKARHRIEWLIEGLTHKDAALRQSAAEGLRVLTGEHFGYHHDLPRRDRELAQARWRQWWHEVGRRRFAREDDERQRPTAMLPVKRD